MTATATKTLEGTLAPPTAHKERRLQRTVATYHRVLEDAFESGAETQTASTCGNPYTLTSYAKDALKSNIPQLCRTYTASELADDYPVRFTNRGWRLDYSEDHTHEFCWRVPQAGSGNAFWIPLRINPAQRKSWRDLLDGDVSVGEFSLTENRINWVVHVTVEYEVAEPEEPDDPTPVGFDIGKSKLLTGCTCRDGTPTELYMYDGGRKAIKTYYEQVADSYGLEPLTTLRSVQDHLSDLCMLGFLRRTDRNRRESGGRYYEYELDLDAKIVIDTRAGTEDEESPV